MNKFIETICNIILVLCLSIFSVTALIILYLDLHFAINLLYSEGHL